jgi:3-keto-5-aminohexanoate cleavage enzyme
MLAMAVVLGGHIRTGLEDVLFSDGEHASNTSLVTQAKTIIEALGKEVATPEEARKILNL